MIELRKYSHINCWIQCVSGYLKKETLKILSIIERAQISKFCCVMIGYVRLGWVNVKNCPTELEPSAGARNRRKATLKI